MYIEKQREAAQIKRQGNARRTIVQLVWLGFWIVVAYFLTGYLFENSYLTSSMFYNTLDIPRSVPEGVFFWAVVFVIVVIMQIFLVTGFILGTPLGRQKAGQASAFTNNPDPLDNQFGN